MTQIVRKPERAEPARSSLFVSGDVPRRRWLVIAVGALIGFALTVIWSAEFVDRTIGDNVVGTLLEEDAGTRISGIGAGIAFAFVSGLAGTFTACNAAAFGALAPLVGRRGAAGGPVGAAGRVRAMLRPLAWLAAGMLAVSATYGVVVALVGTSMPQFQTSGPGTWSPRLVQAMIVYGIIGALMLWQGLAALNLAPDPLARLAARHPNAPMLLMGAVIGAFLIGRPFALFRQMFRDAAESGNVLYGAAAFSLQSLGNIAVMTLLFLAVALLGGRRLQGWLAARPSRATAIVAGAFLIAGVFLIMYWDVRILARRDVIWYPMAPWA
ncbi:hypothetical protein ACH35V_34500 [Actinomadura sp. 1N219]|uniref:hypothetical protein n=1 Tax=Actinomadura sp. 1N219 TaxID=3375152 RepID=UPI0037941EBF